VSADQYHDGVDPLVAMYPEALPQVYGYLLPRCGSVAVAEDLTAETFMAAVALFRRENEPQLTVAWLIGVARHKLVDHWRRTAREQRGFMVAESGIDDPWDTAIDTDAAHAALRRLSGQHPGGLSRTRQVDLTVFQAARRPTHHTATPASVRESSR
jgi:RNA polymerase sigma-70 factor, ECF subfamily